MAKDTPLSVRALLLTRRGVAFAPAAGEGAPEDHLRAVELELAEIGFVLSTKLRIELAKCALPELATFVSSTREALLAQLGGDRKHEPLFRKFPDGIPGNTLELWWSKVLVHFLQSEEQPCLFCGRSGTTHVLNPCQHVVCDHCFDGANYSACPICEHHVDRSSPFFQPSPQRDLPTERVTFKILHLGQSQDDEAKRYFVALCERKQALSPADRDALVAILREYKSSVFEWLPAKIPVRENVTIVLGTLFRECDPAVVLPYARRYMTTATDVLRFIAVLSGVDGSLQRETVFKTVERISVPYRYWEQIVKLLSARTPQRSMTRATIPMRVRRFKVAKLSRPLRRALFDVLEGLEGERLVEDMLRHRSYWVWIGEFLHPHEFAQRYPKVARAFQIVRKKGPGGSPVPPFRTWYSRVEEKVARRDVWALLGLLSDRPGELARRIDLALRLAGDDAAAIDRTIDEVTRLLPSFATPLLAMLNSHLSTRLSKASVRVFWPKGQIAKGVSSPDNRAVLTEPAIHALRPAIDAELLRRFAQKPPFTSCLIDEALKTVCVPFNERTASPAAVNLPRGSRINVPVEKTLRLYLHWCQPKQGANTTDIDLSVALYDDAWRYLGVCSYYSLQLADKAGRIIAQSSGDLRDGPWPDGATEFVDLHCHKASRFGARYAVMVVNNYCGLPFSLLERGFAGLMLREDIGGQHFDPRTVELKFTLNGENGIFMPLVVDLQRAELHWLDVQSKGQFQMNNVENAKSAISKICPELISYFASGARPSMYDLALLHAAARCNRVTVRGANVRQFVRRSEEDHESFYRRLAKGECMDATEPDPISPSAMTDGPPAFAVLYKGDLDLPVGSSVYALFRERLVPSLAASDLLS